LIIQAKSELSPQCYHRPADNDRRIESFDRKQIKFCDENDNDLVLTANTAGGFIERMWAYRTIKKYGEKRSIDAEGEVEQDAIDRNILRIALKVC
jgi:hypothetical protein